MEISLFQDFSVTTIAARMTKGKNLICNNEDDQVILKTENLEHSPPQGLSEARRGKLPVNHQ
jgi:hypothetical protein